MENFFYKKDRLSQLKGFCATVQSNCSITKAAEKLCLEQAAVSKQIQALERDLGIKLFDRETKYKRLILTEVGNKFYKEAIGIIQSMDSLYKGFAKDMEYERENILRIALHQTATAYIFPPILEKMLKLKKFKDLKIIIHNVGSTEAIKKLLDKEVDLVFGIQNVRDKTPVEIETIKVIQSHAFLIFNKSHPLAKKDIITIEDLKKYKFLKRSTELKTLTNIDIKTSNIEIVGMLPPSTVIEIIKHIDSIAIIPNISLDKNFIDKDIVIKDIEHLLNEKAFFNIMTLKNYCFSEPVMWIVNELKKLNNI